MAKSYKGVNLNGDTLMHYRTKGSRNGYSKNPNYRAVGQKAKGQLINGQYVYDNPNAAVKTVAKGQTVSGAPTKFGSNAVSVGSTGVSAGKIGYFDSKKAAKQTKKLVKKAPNNPEMNDQFSSNYKSFGDQIQDIQREQWNKKYPMATNQTQGSKVLYDKPTGFFSKAIMENSKKGITAKNPNMFPFQSKTDLTPEQISKTLSVGKFLQQHTNKGANAARLHKLKDAATPKMTSAMANDPRYTQQAKNPNGRPRARQKVVSTGGKGVQIREKSANSGMGNDPRYTKVDPAYRKSEIAKKSEAGAKNNWQQQAAAAQGNQTSLNAYNNKQSAGYVSGSGKNAKVHQQSYGPVKKYLGGLITTQDHKETVSSLTPTGTALYHPQLVADHNVYGTSPKKSTNTKSNTQGVSKIKKQEKAAKKQKLINKIKNIFSKKKK